MKHTQWTTLVVSALVLVLAGLCSGGHSNTFTCHSTGFNRFI